MSIDDTVISACSGCNNRDVDGADECPKGVPFTAEVLAKATQDRIDTEIVYLLTLRVLGDSRAEEVIEREARRMGDQELRDKLGELQLSLESVKAPIENDT